jgi:hypothetical protein
MPEAVDKGLHVVHLLPVGDVVRLLLLAVLRLDALEGVVVTLKIVVPLRLRISRGREAREERGGDGLGGWVGGGGGGGGRKKRVRGRN